VSIFKEERQKLKEQFAASMHKNQQASNQWIKEEDSLKKTIEELMSTQNSLNVFIDQLRDSLSDAEYDKQTLEEKCARHEDAIVLHENEIKSLKKTVRDRDGKIMGLESIIQEDKRRLDSLELSLSGTQNKLIASEDAFKALALKMSTFTQDLAKAQMESKNAHSRAVKAEQELASTVHRLNDMIALEEEKVARRALLKLKAFKRAHERRKKMELHKSESMPASFADSDFDDTPPKPSSLMTRLPHLGDKDSMRLQRASSGTHRQLDHAEGHTDGKNLLLLL
jgi:chromosome segregation ATPase